ncbi:uncharacterized protein LOC130047391 isoform X2 [Ostrea edulis]|uniref:uncharacterized protein LOC130047391 isoform X2 n=1 Tax=Ostrea edulis TaxID=37623 RepID=UPI0024AEFF36|nr:uncharacterized protein LOC130047391 isoform X2 [Ostrea edulis]
MVVVKYHQVTMKRHLIGCVAILMWTAANVLAIDTTHIMDGLSLANDLTGFIESQDFSKTITKLASAASSYLGILGPVLGFVFSFFDTGPSAELLAIQKLYKDVTLRFDRVDHQFSDVKRQINWASVELQYGEYESKIHAVGEKYKDLVLSSTKNDYTARKQLFLDNFQQDFTNSAEKLYDGVMNEHRTFHKDLFDSAIENFKWDRKKTQSFMLGVSKLLMFGASIELAYYQLKYPSQESYYRQQWQVKFEHFKSKLTSTDHKLETQFGGQLAKDVDQYIVNHAHSSNCDITNPLYDVIAKKYYWRNWLVVVSDHSTDSEKYTVHTCGGIYGLQNNNHGKNVVVASVPQNKAHLTTSQKHAVLHTATYHTRHRHGGRSLLRTGRYVVRVHANDAYNSMSSSVRTSCSTYGSVGIIDRNLYPCWRSPADHLFSRDDGHFFKIYAFG